MRIGARGWLAFLLGAWAAIGCSGGLDDAGLSDARGGRVDIVFGPNDSGGTGGTGDVRPTDGASVDVAVADGAVADGGAPGDTGGADVVARPDSGDGGGPPPVDTVRPDVPRDVAGDVDPCQDNGLGCPCPSDQYCLAWDDGDLCNGRLVCRQGRCAPDPATVVQCPPADGICTDQRCQPSSGRCVEVILAEEGQACEDGNPCSGGDTCRGGVCTAGPQNLCGGGGCHEITALSCGAREPVTTSGPGADLFPDLAPTDVIAQYSCAAGQFPGPEKSYSLVVAPNTQVVFKITAKTVMAMFLIPYGPDCEVASCVGSTHPSGTFNHKDAAGGKYWVVVDTIPDWGQSTELNIGCYPRRAEQRVQCVVGSAGGDDCFICDDDVDNDWDGTTDCADSDCADDPICIPRVCGDGICHPTAEDAVDCPEDCAECGDDICSEGYEVCDVCLADCGVCPICGERGCEQGETCTSCPGDCGECTTPCADEDIVCGQTDSENSLPTSNDLSGYACGCSSGGSGDRIYRFMSPTTRSVTARLTIDEGFSGCSDYDLYVVEAECRASACIECSGGSSCTDAATFTAQAGVPYLIVVESYSGTSSGFDLRVTCN